MTIEQNVPLAPYTTFALGGPAAYFAHAESLSDVREALEFAQHRHLPVFVLGGGSNTLVSDEGFPGLVIQLDLTSDCALQDDGPHALVTAAAGDAWDEFVAFATSHGVWGVENLSGIPGSVGGAVVQAIGAYGTAIGETLKSVDVLDTRTGDIRTMTNAECRFDYRDSFFKHDDGRHIVLSATFRLSKTPAPNLTYKDLRARFPGGTASLEDIRACVLDIRHGKFPDIAHEGTAGSFFKNPIMSKEQAEVLKARYPDMPLFAMPETSGIKVPLAWLMDKALALHGMRVGGARLFERQALVIAASRDARADDVKQLALLVEKKVFDELKIKIEPEVKIL